MEDKIQNALKELRNELRLSQSQMGNILSVVGVTYGQWETGKRSPSFETLYKICTKLNKQLIISEEVVEFRDIEK